MAAVSGAGEQEPDHRRSRLKIRRAPSSAAPASCSSSFHGRCKQVMINDGCTPARKPLIFHTFDPEVILTEPAEFRSLVQRLTGSPATRKLMRAAMPMPRKRKKMELRVCTPVQNVVDRELSAAKQDPLKEGRTIILAPAAVLSCTPNYADCAPINDSPAAASPTYPDCSRLSSHEPSAISQAYYGANPFAAPSLVPCTQQLNLNANHPANHPPLLSISANSATHEENYSAYTSPMSINSPLSPNSSLTTSSEGCFSMEEGGALSSCREVFFSLEEDTEENGGIIFFDFSRDAYYGSHVSTAVQDEEDQFFSFKGALDPF